MKCLPSWARPARERARLLGILSGLDTPTDGQVFINGREITHLSESKLASVRNREIGYVFQTFNLIATLSAEENVELPVQLNRESHFHPGKRAREVLASVGLTERRKHRPAELSGGEQQRVAIARALVNDPAVIFADEPTGNLDSTNGAAVLDLLITLNRETGKSFVIVTHDPSIAQKCHRTVYMRDGELTTERTSVRVRSVEPAMIGATP